MGSGGKGPGTRATIVSGSVLDCLARISDHTNFGVTVVNQDLTSLSLEPGKELLIF